MRVDTGDRIELPCDCGGHRFNVVVGESHGWAEIRTVQVDIGHGITEECLVALKHDGEAIWIDYPSEDSQADGEP